MKFSFGFSPCPNDTFMMDALVHHRIDSGDLDLDIRMHDVEQLNLKALDQELDITKVSFHTYLKIKENYQLLDAGAALGFGCGPLLIALKALTTEDIQRGPIALPGEHTTAHMLFMLKYPLASNKKHLVFSDIEKAVLAGDAAAGVIIHENRFTYQDRGLLCLEDLGSYWEQKSGHPIPLGAIVAHKRLGTSVIKRIDQALHDSIQFAFDHPAASHAYVSKHAQEMNEEVMQQHIATYVNQFSLSLGREGHAAVASLEQHALALKII